jgi:undecaprenyl diphosphate synthase
LPRHVGLIPDGNRRWATGHGLSKEAGYAAGIRPGSELLRHCRALGIEEVSIYGFTIENTHRARVQVEAFQHACVAFAAQALEADAALLVIGNSRSSFFPRELLPYGSARSSGCLRVNLLVNYSWSWDVRAALDAHAPSRGARRQDPSERLGSRGASRIDLVVRWGGRSRLSGFLPFQSAYADVRVIDTLWPDMRLAEFDQALDWYARQDVTLGG